jgi:hypothetical protein
MPQPKEIMKQLNVILNQWDHFAYESRDFNMKLERKSYNRGQGGSVPEPIIGPNLSMPGS